MPKSGIASECGCGYTVEELLFAFELIEQITQTNHSTPTFRFGWFL
jgi:hypothetical protein